MLRIVYNAPVLCIPTASLPRFGLPTGAKADRWRGIANI